MKELTKRSVCPEVMIIRNESNEGLHIEVALPGVDRKAVDLSFGDHHFCVSGDREEFTFDGCYELAHEVAKTKANAVFDNGLLKVDVPFLEMDQAVKVSIH